MWWTITLFIFQTPHVEVTSPVGPNFVLIYWQYFYLQAAVRHSLLNELKELWLQMSSNQGETNWCMFFISHATTVESPLFAPFYQNKVMAQFLWSEVLHFTVNEQFLKFKGIKFKIKLEILIAWSYDLNLSVLEYWIISESIQVGWILLCHFIWTQP